MLRRGHRRSVFTALNGAAGRLRFMLQALFADRFRVHLHRQAREGRVFALVVGPSGPNSATGNTCF